MLSRLARLGDQFAPYRLRSVGNGFQFLMKPLQVGFPLRLPCQPTFPAHSADPACRVHIAFAMLSVLFGCPTAHAASLPISLFTYRVAYPAATPEPHEPSRGHVSIFHTVPSAHTLVRRVTENAFASIVQARPSPVYGRPVRQWDRSLGYGPVFLRRPFGLHLAVDALPCPTVSDPERHYPRFLDMAPLNQEPEGLEPS